MLGHAFVKSGFRAARVAGLACLLAATAASAAHAMNNVGWVWADEPAASSSYTPDTGYSYNSSGGTITITPYGAGEYYVEFGGLYDGSPDDVQVTAYNTSGYCTANSWYGSGTTMYIFVECFDKNGSAANNYFTLLYQSHSTTFGTADVGLAYLWANDRTTGSYTPSSYYSYNSTGGTNTIRRHSTGNYTVTLPGLTKTGGDVQVTEYSGYSEPARCNVVEWGASSAGTKINVKCYNTSGEPADEYFNLLYGVGVPLAVTKGYAAKGVWAWANDDTSTSVYTPDRTYQYNEFETGRLTAQEVGTGEYLVEFPGSPSYSTSLVLVTAYANNSNYCNVDDWGSDYLYVLCYDEGGNLADTQFDVTFQTAP
jgi:hypothetical protein